MDDLMAATRFRSPNYIANGIERFSLFEKTLHGVLITDFNSNGEVLSQIYSQKSDLKKEADEYLSVRGAEVRYLDYEKLLVKASCADCGSMDIVRVLDTIDVSRIVDIPVVPLFSCTNCKARLFSITDEYLGRLVKSNPDLFDKSEIEKRDRDWNAFINELRQYIVSVFAMKKIKHLKM